MKDIDVMAFPIKGALADHQEAGMTLRDYFAAKALQGMMTQWAVGDNELPEYGACAQSAYSIADAMLRERLKP